MEDIGMKYSSDSKLYYIPIFYIRILSRNQDIFEFLRIIKKFRSHFADFDVHDFAPFYNEPQGFGCQFGWPVHDGTGCRWLQDKAGLVDYGLLVIAVEFCHE